jgi:hypothetical protein
MGSILKGKHTDLKCQLGYVGYCAIIFSQLLLLFLTRNVTNRSPRFTPPPVWSPTNGSNDGSLRASPSLADRSPVRAQKANNDDELITFLNSSEPPVDRISEEVSFVILCFSPFYNIVILYSWSSTVLSLDLIFCCLQFFI